MKDYIGNELSIGDKVAFMVPGYRELASGVITGFSNCYVYIDRKPSKGKADWITNIKQTPNQIIKIETK
jgi:hypothetical protein